MSTPISASAGMRLKQIQLFQRYSYFHSYKINQLFQQPPKKCNTICNRLTDWKNIENPPNMPMKSKAKHTSDSTSASCMLDLTDAFSASTDAVESDTTLDAMLSSCGTRGGAQCVSQGWMDVWAKGGSACALDRSLARTYHGVKNAQSHEQVSNRQHEPNGDEARIDLRPHAACCG